MSKTLTEIITTASDVMSSVFVVVAGFGLILFFWGVVNLLFNAENQEAIQKWRHSVLWGLIAFTAVFSLGAILAILQNTFFK